MAKTKDIPEVYLCETDADRESIVPYAGQKCIMQNGDIYACFRAGVWGKIGEEPTPPTPPVPPTPIGEFTINVQDGQIMSGFEEQGVVYGQLDYSLNLEPNASYEVTFKLNGEPLGTNTVSVYSYLYNDNSYNALLDYAYLVDNAKITGIYTTGNDGYYPIVEPDEGKTAWWVPDWGVGGEIQPFAIEGKLLSGI